MPVDWLLRVGNGENLKNSSKYKIWGIQTITSTHGKHFIENVAPGDRLWFVKSKSQGKLIAVATYRSHNKREHGPLIDVTLTNEELGWYGSGIDWTSDTEIHYKDLYVLNECELFTRIKGPATIRKYDSKCDINLPVEYGYITRYSKVKFTL